MMSLLFVNETRFNKKKMKTVTLQAWYARILDVALD